MNVSSSYGISSSRNIFAQMNLLEDEVGASLFDRSHRGLKLTRAGESFYKDVKYLLKYAHEAELRARKAMWEDGNLIRIGASPMTPSAAFSELWPKIQQYCPDMRFRIVNFENTPENAAEILANLGQNIDVVFGVFDDTLLSVRKCQGYILYDVPICVAVSLTHPLASKEELAIEDLYGENLLLMHRGWSESVDALRDDILAKHRDIHIVDFDFYGIDIFNRCSNSSDVLMAIGRWNNVHPLLKVIPVKWNYTIPYGILYSEDPSPPVERLLDTVSYINFSSNQE